MRISKEAYEILDNIYCGVLKKHNLGEDPKGWPEFKNSINEYIYFNEIGFITIFKMSRRGEYRGGPETYHFRAKLPAIVVEDMVDAINNMFPESNPLVSGKKIARGIKQNRVQEILNQHVKEDEIIKCLVDDFLGKDGREYYNVSFIGYDRVNLKKEHLNISGASFEELLKQLEGTGTVEQYTLDLSDKPEILKELISIPKAVTPEEVSIINQLVDILNIDKNGGNNHAE